MLITLNDIVIQIISVIKDKELLKKKKLNLVCFFLTSIGVTTELTFYFTNIDLIVNS